MKISKILTLILAFIAFSPFSKQEIVCSDASINKHSTILKLKSEAMSASQIVFSYTTVMEHYYEIVASQVTNPTKNLEIFVADFSDWKGNGFCEYLLNFANENNVELDLFGEEKGARLGVPDYVLSNSQDEYAKTSTPKSLFKRKPMYYSYYLSSIEEGDIVIETNTIFDVGHAAIISYVSKNSEFEDIPTYVQTIEATVDYVYFGFLDDIRMIDYGVEIYRPDTRAVRLIAEAVYFCEDQIGKPYKLKPKMNISESSPDWYCSELLYAAYKNAGLDMGARRTSDGTVIYLKDAVLPADIVASYNTEKRTINNSFLELSIVGKSGTSWSINVTNRRYSTITAEINMKMCDLSDGQNWTNLNDILNVSIPSRSTTNVSIAENYFATTITASYTLTKNNKTARLITYANNLDSSTKTLSVNYWIIEE